MPGKIASLLMGVAGLASGGVYQATAASFKHIVIVIQENRTPDNLFGSNPAFEPGVDIATSGKNSQGNTIALSAEPLAGCYDISHVHKAFVSLYDGGKMDGANNESLRPRRGCRPPADPQYKFVANTKGEVQPYFDIAKQYGFANRMFQTNQGPSFPAHQFLFGGTSAPDDTSTLFASENVHNLHHAAGCVAVAQQRVLVIDAAGSEKSHPPIYPCFSHSTIVPLLEQAGLTWTYYVNTKKDGSIWDAPVAIRPVCAPQKFGLELRCSGTQYTAHVESRKAQVLNDIANCNLANVSWVIPDAKDSDHAAVNEGRGPAWVASIVNAIGTHAACPNNDTYWADTAILIMWDDWGGWYDHVPPYHVGGWGGPLNWGSGYIYGMRVPLLTVSAYTPAGYVDNANHDFGSVLRFVESNFGLGLIGPGHFADAYADNLSAFFTLPSARPFTLVPAKLTAGDFLNATRSDEGPDDD